MQHLVRVFPPFFCIVWGFTDVFPQVLRRRRQEMTRLIWRSFRNSW